MIGRGKEREGTNQNDPTFFKVACVLGIYKTRPLRPRAEGNVMKIFVRCNTII
jgi:hypothetical protein